MAGDNGVEGREGVNRVEAFSDGVIAIIVTIMVLELKAPEEQGITHLLQLWPTFLAYILSYVYVAIYWINHHRMFSHARLVTGSLLWANMALLFTLSLVPFATAYLGEHHFARDATLLYLLSLLLPGIAYNRLQSEVRRTGQVSQSATTYHHATDRKGKASVVVYVLGMALSFVSPWLGVACAALVAVFWILPWGPLDRLFLPKEDVDKL
jgi:uncharacterized membrane protein